MALFRMDNLYGWSPEMFNCAGSVSIPSGYSLTANNLQINPVLLNSSSGGGLPNPGTSNLASNETIAPLGAKGLFFLNPTAAAAGAATNQNGLPRGLPASATPTGGSELLIDLSGFQADIICAQANLYTAARGPLTRTAYVSCVDNINKLVYVQIVTVSSNAAVSVSVGDVIAFDVTLKDTFSI